VSSPSFCNHSVHSTASLIQGLTLRVLVDWKGFARNIKKTSEVSEDFRGLVSSGLRLSRLGMKQWRGKLAKGLHSAPQLPFGLFCFIIVHDLLGTGSCAAVEESFLRCLPVQRTEVEA
jgi:hypothetical protein